MAQSDIIQLVCASLHLAFMFVVHPTSLRHLERSQHEPRLRCTAQALHIGRGLYDTVRLHLFPFTLFFSYFSVCWFFVFFCCNCPC